MLLAWQPHVLGSTWTLSYWRRGCLQGGPGRIRERGLLQEKEK
jgi:hypothetical protein